MPLPCFRVTERQVLTLLLVASLIAVGGAILGSSFFTGAKKKIEPVTQARIRWMRPGSGAVRQMLADYFDPSALSLPSPLGFSRGPWQHRAPPAPTRYQPFIPAAFLAPITDLVTPALLPQSSLGAVIQAGLERPVFAVVDDVPTDEVPVVTNSVLQLEGTLARRRMFQPPGIPLAPATVTVRRTSVLVAVGADGRVRHAVLERSCGHEALDTEAVELTRQLRFEPLAAADALAVTWGTARFVWANAPAN